jgi:hypothetical protein
MSIETCLAIFDDRQEKIVYYNSLKAAQMQEEAVIMQQPTPNHFQ